ncbi:MAG: hypothetical protein AABZ80_12940 [Gemmatimonadota bacterium]
MPSRVDRWRAERALRLVAFASLMAWIANAARPALARVDVATDSSLNEALPRWTRAANVDSVHAQLDTVPDAAGIAWLGALARGGVGMSWSGPGIPAMALEAFPSAEPAGGVTVLAGAPAASVRVVSDALGPLDTLVGGPTSAVRFASLEGGVTFTSGIQPARVGVAPRGATRRVLVTGAAGWEAKFVVAALEEAGWMVDARVFISPDHDVTQGALAALDTARYSAVVLLDSAGAERARGVERFVRDGGGVVLAGDAGLSPRVASLMSWRVLKRELAPLGTLAGDTSWRGLSRLPLQPTSPARPVVLERRGGRATLVARRHHGGRVVALAYDQTWRWRMAGGDSSRVEHRAWWSRVVAGVAFRSVASSDVTTGAAPLASLYAALGPPSPSVRALPLFLSPSALSNALGVLLFAALLAEWWLRRARGAR